MEDDRKLRQFHDLLSPHLEAAYNYARWLARNPQDAEDVVQEACLRAMEYLGSFRGENGRAWLLSIVRNTLKTRAGSAAARREVATLFEEGHETEQELTSPDAHTLLLRHLDVARVRRGLEELPIVAREALVLRELEGFSYKEISEVTGVPIGTVMSRLARARSRLKQVLIDLERNGGQG